jgi:hypothetical protein
VVSDIAPFASRSQNEYSNDSRSASGHERADHEPKSKGCRARAIVLNIDQRVADECSTQAPNEYGNKGNDSR